MGDSVNAAALELALTLPLQDISNKGISESNMGRASRTAATLIECDRDELVRRWIDRDITSWSFCRYELPHAGIVEAVDERADRADAATGIDRNNGFDATVTDNVAVRDLVDHA